VSAIILHTGAYGVRYGTVCLSVCLSVAKVRVPREATHTVVEWLMGRTEGLCLSVISFNCVIGTVSPEAYVMVQTVYSTVVGGYPGGCK
jgi:hypothetical protein